MRAREGMVLVAVLGIGMGLTGQQPPSTPASGSPTQTAPGPGRSTNLGTDANGNPLRLAIKTNHVSNYDESKVGNYTLPDPLRLQDGKPVADDRAWARRRQEILRQYEAQIYGRVPSNAPRVTWRVTETDTQARDGAAIRKRVAGTVGEGTDAPQINLTLYTPANVERPVPVILLVTFGGGPPRPISTAQGGGTPPARGRGGPLPDPPVAAEILARGWGYATVGYHDIQPDRLNTWNQGVIGRTLAGKDAPGPDEWGTISAWAWGISRVLDYFESAVAVNARQVAVQGHSRLGKTVLWASAKDERIAAVFSSCSGEMGAALARRDWGETVDDMAQNFSWQFAGNFQQWVGRWNEMPVDAHMLIALSAPRPVVITGGTTDQWADPVGMFKALVAAGPVYRLLGKRDLGTTDLPALDTPLTSGDLGWHYHTGGHTATPADWKAFLEFVSKYFADSR